MFVIQRGYVITGSYFTSKTHKYLLELFFNCMHRVNLVQGP